MSPAPSALVTGANKGIGLAMAEELVKRGWRVFLGSRDIGRGEAAAKSLTGPGSVQVVQLDVTSDASVAAAADAVRLATASDGGLTGLVNNAGTASSMGYTSHADF